MQTYRRVVCYNILRKLCPEHRSDNGMFKTLTININSTSDMNFIPVKIYGFDQL